MASKVSLFLTPASLSGIDLSRQAVVVFDVLRATTTITAALAAGVNPIYVFGRVDDARHEAGPPSTARILAGEQKCLAPDGFDRGNSPGGFSATTDAGRPMFMATTNGTRALAAVAAAPLVLAGALVNAAAVADILSGARARAGATAFHDILLLCAGTEGQPSMEDLLGCGAVISELAQRQAIDLQGDLARIALRLFAAARADLPATLANSQGGRNVTAAGLADDIAFAAQLNSLQIVGQLQRNPLRIVPAWH